MVRSQGSEGDPQTQKCVPKARSRGMEEEGVPPTQHRAQTVCGQVSKGATPTRQRVPPAYSQGKE